jgi:serine/threonine protein kinase/tetratricopeptide (TPR) repeat protein
MDQLKCRHGHRFEVATPAEQRVVCPLCGSATTPKAEHHTPGQGPLDKTVFAPEPMPADAPFASEGTHVSGRTVIVEAPQALEPARELPAPADQSVSSGNDLAKVPTSDVPTGSLSSTTGLSSGSLSGTGSKSHSGPRTKTAMPTEVDVTEPPKLPGYKVVNELGRGGMGVVYRAFDEKLDRHVALKTLQRISPVGLQRFKQEFRALADVSHPNLAALYDLLSDGQTWCFTMEILDAVDFLEYVWSRFERLNRDKGRKLIGDVPKAGTRLSLAIMQRLYDGLKQLALGLHALHEAGVLHRDIKPSNILVTLEGRVVLVDFGLAAQIEGDGRPQGVQGTPDYMAPEQAAGKPATPASDWYAVGVMLYEILTGRLPIQGKALQVLFKKQTETPPEPRELEPTVPQELNDLCVALLQRDPAQRPSVFDILRRIGADDVAETLRGKSGQRIGQSLELVGRERHFAVLRNAFEQVQNGATRSVFVQGKSGMGKSVLIQSFLEEIQNQGGREPTALGRDARQSVGPHDLANVPTAVVLTGRCYEQESVPFKALDSLMDSLAAHLSKLLVETLRPILPEDSLPLVRLFPVMGQLSGATDAGKPSIDNVDQQELRQRAMNALRELLTSIGHRQPLVLYIDDLQWGDVDSAMLLGDLVRPPDSPRVLLLGSYRSEYVASSSCLKALATAYTTGQAHPHRHDLAVEALLDEEATRLALLLLKRDDMDSIKFAAKIARESGGRPFFVWELVQHIQDAPEFAEQTLELDEVIWSRVCRLPDETRRLLELIAVAGRPIVLAEAYRALDVGAIGQNLMVQLRTRNLIRANESEDDTTLVETYHDRIRESVVNHLDERTRQRYNLDLAETILKLSGISVEMLWAHLMGATSFEEPTGTFSLERPQWRRVYDLSHFFAAAGEPGKALPFALIAAEQARQQNALEVAEQQYRTALLGSAASIPALRFRILEGLGDVLILRGRYDDANEQLQAARVLAKENVTLARIDGKLGRSSFNKGDIGVAVNDFEKALTALNERPPGNLLSLLLRMSKEGIVQLLHTFFPYKFVGRNNMDSPQGRMDLFRARLFDNLTLAYWFSRSMEMVLWSHLRQMNLAERYPPTQELGHTYSFHAITMTAIPLAQRGINYAQRAFEISVEAGDLWGQGKARSYHTFACIVLARFQEGLRTGAEAVRLLEQAGDVWEANMARMIATVPMYHLGDLKSVSRESRKAYEIGLETGDYSAVCISLLFWIPAAPHLIPRGAIQKEVDRKREDPLSIAAAYYARGLELLLCEDNPSEAAKVLQDSLDRAKKRGLRNVCIFSAMTWKATALRIVAERSPEGAARQRALRAAHKACRAALSITKSYRACPPHALRETGIVAAMKGNEAQAKLSFEESLKVAGEYEARYDLAKTRLAQAEAGMKFGWPNSTEQAAEARAAIQELENVEGI